MDFGLWTLTFIGHASCAGLREELQGQISTREREQLDSSGEPLGQPNEMQKAAARSWHVHEVGASRGPRGVAKIRGSSRVTVW